MKALILLVDNDFKKKSDVLLQLQELAKYEHGDDSILICSLDDNIYPGSLYAFKDLWPKQLNLCVRGMSTSDAGVLKELFHLAVKFDADVYQIGDDTGAAEYLTQMGIEVTKMPLE